MAREFGAKLTYLRTQRQLSQAELARQLTVSRQHVNNLERDRKAPSLDVVLRAATLFTVTTEYLLRAAIPVPAVQYVKATPHPLHEIDSASFGAKLRYQRTKHMVTQAELVHRLGLRSQAHISLLEASQVEPSPAMVLLLADLFGVTTDYLLRPTIAVSDDGPADSTIPTTGT